MKSKCIDMLIAEHKIILRGLDVLSAIAAEAAQGNSMNRYDVRGLLEIFRQFADEFHQGKEEGGLFPVFTAGCHPDEFEPIRHMLFEHEQDRSLLDGIEDSLLNSNAGDFCEFAHRLEEILRTHIYKEDNILFEMIDKSLSSEDDKRVCGEFEAYDRAFEDRGGHKLLHRLRMLEWKYLRKAA